MNSKVTLLIPVRRDADKLARCIRSVKSGTVVPRIVVMDCTADPQALRGVREAFPDVRFFDMGMNPGRAHTVNTGIHITQTPYVMTLSPGILAGKHCVERLSAALDVYEEEPLPADDPAWTCPNLLVTPHIAGNMTLPYTVEKIVSMFLSDLDRYAQGLLPERKVDLKKGY